VIGALLRRGAARRRSRQLGGASASGASSGRRRRAAGRRTDTLWSQSLGTTKALTVYLPPSYAQAPSRRYPVLVYLHGARWRTNATGWTRAAASHHGLARAAGGPEAIIAMPDGDDAGTPRGPRCPTSGVSGRHGTPRTGGDVLRPVAALRRLHRARYRRARRCHYRTRRAIAAPRHRRFEHGGLRRHHARAGATPTCSPPQRVTRACSLFFDCGVDDPYLGHSRGFAAALRGLGVPYTFREHAGTHNWDYWRTQLPVSLSWLLEQVRPITSDAPAGSARDERA
jgi:hypothetical protein